MAKKYVGNPNGFVYALATRYFSVTTAAVRQYDTHHLILGVKAEAQEIQPQLLEAAKPYVNVFSIDDYTLKPGLAQAIDKVWPQYLPVTSTFSNFESYVKRPIMVGEYSFIGSGPQTRTRSPASTPCMPRSKHRADAYTNYIAPLYEDAPWVVGDEWFEYVDEPEGGRFDGENNDFGVVDVENQAYQDLVAQMEIDHSIAPDRLVPDGSRSATRGRRASGGVTCTADMTYATYPPSIATTSLPAGTQGTAYSGTIMAVGGRPSYRFTLTAGHVPSQGPQARCRNRRGVGHAGFLRHLQVHTEVTDSTSPKPRTTTRVVSLKISPRAVTIRTATLHRAFVGISYSDTLAATWGAPPYAWTLAKGSVPPGLKLDADGALVGTPTAAGTYGFTVKVTDSFDPADSATRSLSLLVSPAPKT